MRGLWYAIGVIALILEIIGIALPIMPTVPFLLVAAWAFARSSPRLRQKILSHPTYGPSVRAWQERGAISRFAKLWAVGAMAAGVAFAAWLSVPVWLVAGQAAVCSAIAIFVVTRPGT